MKNENLNLDYNKEVLVRRALLRYRFKIEAARELGITYRTLYGLIKKYDINTK